MCVIPLFLAETEQGVAQAIIRSVVDFRREPWPKVSDNAKDLVKKMLDPDPKRRLTAQEVLGIYIYIYICISYYCGGRLSVELFGFFPYKMDYYDKKFFDKNVRMVMLLLH